MIASSTTTGYEIDTLQHVHAHLHVHNCHAGSHYFCVCAIECLRYYCGIVILWAVVDCASL